MPTRGLLQASPRLTDREASPFAYIVFPTALQLLLFLPVVLAGLWLVRPRPDAKDAAAGVMRFSLGYAKWVLLVSPLYHLSAMILCGTAETVSTGLAWMLLPAFALTLYFLITGADDLVTGSLGMLGLQTPERLRKVLAFHFFTRGRHNRFLIVIGILTLLGLPVVSSFHGDAGLFLRALAVSTPVGNPAAVFQQARAWSNFNLIIVVAALFCAFGLPRTDDFLRQPLRWKGVVCLSLFALSVVMLWTRGIPQP